MPRSENATTAPEAERRDTADGAELLLEAEFFQDLGESHRAFISESVESYSRTLAEQLQDVDVTLVLDRDVLGEASARTARALIESLESADAGDLAETRWRIVVRTLGHVAELLVEQARQREVTAQELEAQAQAALDTFNVLVHGRARDLQSVVEALEPGGADDPEEIDEDEAERLGRMRLSALYRKLVNESYSVSELHDRFSLSRQRLKQLRDEERLFALRVPYRKGFRYPRWQFDPATMRPRQSMPELIRAAKEARLDAIGFHQLMTNPAAGNGVSPVELLDQGKRDIVLGVLGAVDH